MQEKNRQTIIKMGIVCWTTIGLLAIVGLIFYFLFLIRLAVIPLIIAAAIAYLLSPLVVFLQKKIPKIIAIIIAYILFLGIIFVLFFFLMPLIVDQFEVFIENLPDYIENLILVVNQFLTESLMAQNIEQYIGTEFMPQDADAITDSLINMIDINGLNILQQVTAFARNVINWIITLVIGPILGFYVLKDAHKFRNVFVKVIPARLKPHAEAIMDRINTVAGRYIRGQLFASFLVGVMCTIALLILRVDFAILLGFIAGALNMMPFLGPILGAIPASLTALFVSPLRALLVVAVFIAIQQIDSYFIFPLIMKHQIKLHPGIIIFSLIAGGAIFGFLGLLLAVPTVAIIQAILKYYLIERKPA